MTLTQLEIPSLDRLNSPIIVQEVEGAILALKPNMAPGPYGFTIEFYKISKEVLS